MAFLRFTRDKRGYEHFYLVEQTNRRGKARARVLYWFRTPPNVKVGRHPFDLDVRRALEAQNPGVEFDWKKIADTPIPSPDVEKWRERRRAERALRRAPDRHSREDSFDQVDIETAPEATPSPPDVDLDAEDADVSIDAESDILIAGEAPAIEPESEAPRQDGTPTEPGHRRRRRRRRGKRPRPTEPAPSND